MFGWMRVLTSRIHGWFSAREIDEEFLQELDAHLELLTEQNIHRGMTSQRRRGAPPACGWEEWRNFERRIANLEDCLWPRRSSKTFVTRCEYCGRVLVSHSCAS